MTQYPIAEVLERLKALLSRATPGPWSVDEDALVTLDPVEIDMERSLVADLRYFTTPHAMDNAALIAEAINALPALLTHLDAVEGENARLTTEVLTLNGAWSNVDRVTHELHASEARAEAAESQLASQAASLAEMREEIARIVDPYAWKLVERALLPFRENRGAQNDEIWLYDTMRRKGFRTEDQVRNFFLHEDPQFGDHTATLHAELLQSLCKADAIIALQNKAES